MNIQLEYFPASHRAISNSRKNLPRIEEDLD